MPEALHYDTKLSEFSYFSIRNIFFGLPRTTKLSVIADLIRNRIVVKWKFRGLEGKKVGCYQILSEQGLPKPHNVKNLTSYRPIVLTTNSTPSPTLPLGEGEKSKAAFTLAEVLITLGIIGVVAAMTMPTLIQKHRRSVVETSLKKFYTTMNQAVNLSVAENGETKYWVFGDNDNSNDSIEDFYKRYLKKYVKTLKTEIITVKIKQQSEVELFTLYFPDGSATAIDWKGHDWYYCIKAKDLSRYVDKKGTGCFMFGFYPTGDNILSPFTYSNYYNKGVEPYVVGSKIEVGKDEEGNPIMEYPTEDTLYEGKFYAKAIQLNGWRIPDDYPQKF